MSNTVFPGAVDTGPVNPSTSDTLASNPHHLQHGFENDAILAIETKLGSGASLQTPTTGSFFVGTGAGTSDWNPSPTNPSFTTSILDTNGKTWIGQTATSNAVNYINIGNSATTVNPTISAAGSDTNLGINLVPKGSGKVQDNGSNLIDHRASFANFVQSGGVWTQTSGLIGGMTAAVIWIAGVEYSVGAVSGHTFGTSVDTYVDYLPGTGVTYNAVSNGSAAPALAAGALRLAKIVTSGSAITSVVQTGYDSLSNPIFNTSHLNQGEVQSGQLAANAITLGAIKAVTNQTGISTIVDLTLLTLTVTVPPGGRDIEVQGLCQFESSTSDDFATLYVFKDGSQVDAQARDLRSGSTAEGLNIFFHDIAPTAGSHIYKLRASGATSVALVASATQPATLVVKVV